MMIAISLLLVGLADASCNGPGSSPADAGGRCSRSYNMPEPVNQNDDGSDHYAHFKWQTVASAGLSLRDVAARGEQRLRQNIIDDPVRRVRSRRSPMPPSVLLELALRILSETGWSVRNPVRIVAPGDFPAIESRIAPLRAFRRRLDGVLDPVIYLLRTTDTFERAAAGHAPSAVLVAGSLFHELIHGVDEALDESHVLAREATFLQEYVIQHVLDLSVVDRRFLERHIDQLRARAKRIVSSFHKARGPAAQDVVQ